MTRVEKTGRSCRRGMNEAFGGERGIRTPGTNERTVDFESTPFDLSGISPPGGSIRRLAQFRKESLEQLSGLCFHDS